MIELIVPTDFFDPLVSPLPLHSIQYLGKINTIIAPGDCYNDNGRHYLYVGATALNVINSCIQLAANPAPKSILDFGSGAGRVTRWLRAAFPDVEIYATDLRTNDLAFLEKNLGCRTSVSSTDFNSIEFPQKFDLIWAGSVLTHLPRESCSVLLRKFFSWLNPGGLALASYHGRHCASCPTNYIEPAEKWNEILDQYSRTGFGYSDYADVRGYGISLTSAQSMASLIQEEGLGKLICIAERAYDEHQDVICIQNNDINHSRRRLAP